MSEAARWIGIADMSMFRTLEHMIDEIWVIASSWRGMARDTVGSQMVRAADSVGANLIEGDARYSFKEKLHFCYIARASLAETGFWLQRAMSRGLMPEAKGVEMLGTCESLLHWINTLISQRKQWSAQVRDDEAPYGDGSES